ncbi:hypothetical protein L1267_10945 [Pseudoalteromonas sp. OFAV1]|jgi:hypothetical protein|uniref:hypothetical protein n=1 Tax=Pseudoalteromonas sp. OFAV1 TaxID=2908892 RepID=UPI001F359EE1|nr:hypothetical protein [Pseudoalteromonas sp. OFAV1]MCF2900920.1 hypothetical protein [Pseudoalteromonas sp. OFAV1]
MNISLSTQSKATLYLSIGLALSAISFNSSANSYLKPANAKEQIESYFNKQNKTNQYDDPFLKLSLEYKDIELEERQTQTYPQVDSKVLDYIENMTEIIQSRKVAQEQELTDLRDTYSNFLNSDVENYLELMYAEYFSYYDAEIDLRRETIRDSQIEMMYSTVITNDNTVGDLTEDYQSSTYNFLVAYRGILEDKRENLYGTDFNSRIDDFNAKNNRILGVLSNANNYLGSCSACLTSYTLPEQSSKLVKEELKDLQAPESIPAYRCMSDTTGVYQAMCSRLGN